MNKKIADALADLGYPVLRSDPAGIGDSVRESRRIFPYRIFGARSNRGIFVEDTGNQRPIQRDCSSLDRLFSRGVRRFHDGPFNGCRLGRESTVPP